MSEEAPALWLLKTPQYFTRHCKFHTQLTLQSIQSHDVVAKFWDLTVCHKLKHVRSC